MLSTRVLFYTYPRAPSARVRSRLLGTVGIADTITGERGVSMLKRIQFSWAIFVALILGVIGAAALALAGGSGSESAPAVEVEDGVRNQLLSESESIAYRLRHLAEPDLPCDGPCMGLKDPKLSASNASVRCAKLPQIPAGAPQALRELSDAARAACAQLRAALNDPSLLEPDRVAAWARPASVELDARLSEARSD